MITRGPKAALLFLHPSGSTKWLRDKDNAAFVVIKNYRFNLSGDECLHARKDNTSGFTTLLDGMPSAKSANLSAFRGVFVKLGLRTLN